jgi:archaellum component FlaF (FlaF/FlaG flagellin family)
MKFIKHRRGLSNVVTTAILLTSVAVMGTGIVAWSNGNLKVFEISLANTSVNATNKINENLAIENVGFCKNCRFPSFPSSVINVTLTNTGTLPLKVTQIQINSTAVQTYWASTSLPTTILPQKSYLVSTIIPGGTTWSLKSLSTITVTTDRGSIFTTQAVAPK